MKPTWTAQCRIVVIVSMGCIQAFAEPFAKGPYLGQTPPGPIAKVFAPGLICSTGEHPWEANGTFSADGNTFCFQRVSGVFITENTDQGWTTPALIKSIPANVWAPWLGCLSADANSIFFTYALLEPLSKRNLYRCIRTPSGWAEPQQLGPPLSSPDKELTCSIAANNNIYFMRGGSGRGIFYAPYENNTWPRIIKLSVIGHDPGIAPDESFMVIANKDQPGGYGHQDLYLVLRLPDGTWSKPRNLGPRINSRFIEFGPRISPDKKYLFFNRSNGWDPRVDGVHSYICWVALKAYLPESYRSPGGVANRSEAPVERRSVPERATRTGSIRKFAQPIPQGPYLGQTPPGTTAQVFAPGLICDTRPHECEAFGHFSADGNTFCFNRRGYVYIAENTEQGWTIPKHAESVPYRTWSCCLSPDANSIYFMYSYDPSKRYHPYRCQRTPDGWSAPQELGPTFSYSGAYAGFSLAADNSIYLFRSKPKGQSRGGGIFYAPYENDLWPRLVKLPQVGTFPGIAPDESFMVFTAIRPEGRGATDLYLSLRRPDGTWSKARNLGPRINSGYYEFGARITQDKKYMFFTRSNGWYENPYRDTSDIYWVALAEYLPESHR